MSEPSVFLILWSQNSSTQIFWETLETAGHSVHKASLVLHSWNCISTKTKTAHFSARGHKNEPLHTVQCSAQTGAHYKSNSTATGNNVSAHHSHKSHTVELVRTKKAKPHGATEPHLHQMKQAVQWAKDAPKTICINPQQVFFQSDFLHL